MDPASSSGQGNTTSTGTSTHSFPPLPGVRVYPKSTRRMAQTVRLKPSSIEEYKICHAAVWPEVLLQIQDCGIRDCKYQFPPFPPPLCVCGED